MKEILVLFLVGLLGQGAIASDLAKKILSLREEVQSVSDEIEALNERLKSKAQSLSISKGELTARLDLLNEEKKVLKKTIADKQEIAGKGPEEIQGLGEIIVKALEGISAYMDSAVPFKIKSRKENVSKLIAKYQNEEMTQERLLEKFWTVVQDELRLSSDVELQQQKIEVNGKSKFVEVVRVGMTSMFFRSLDGEVGAASFENGSWTYKTFNKSSKKNGILKLMNAKKKLIEGEVYSLPLYVQSTDSKDLNVSMESE